MIRGIGTDIVAVARIAALLNAKPEAFPERILHPSEMVDYQNAKDKSAFLAKRFAAKEATAKALGCGIGARLSFTDIAVSHDAAGKPLLTLHRAEFASLKLHLSISDETELALAFVVAEE